MALITEFYFTDAGWRARQYEGALTRRTKIAYPDKDALVVAIRASFAKYRWTDWEPRCGRE